MCSARFAHIFAHKFEQLPAVRMQASRAARASPLDRERRIKRPSYSGGRRSTQQQADYNP